MSDMIEATKPKSDQLNADDLIAGPRTIRIRDVTIRGGQEQPVSIFFDGDDGKPYKPCKSMSRLLVAAWGSDAKKYIGRMLTLYREPTVKWAGLEVGGIRISHMSDIENALTLALTATKGSRKPYTVRPYVTEQIGLANCLALYQSCQTKEEFDTLETERGAMWGKLSNSEKAQLKDASKAALDRITEKQEEV